MGEGILVKAVQERRRAMMMMMMMCFSCTAGTADAHCPRHLAGM
jgi:hypothetical protein